MRIPRLKPSSSRVYIWGVRRWDLDFARLPHARVAEVLHGLRTMEVNVIDFNLHSPNLSDAFIALTGHTLRDQVI